MAKRVTDFRIDTLEIGEGHYWELPTEARKLIEMCGTPLVPKHPATKRWEWPIYRSKELAEMLQNYEYELEDNKLIGGPRAL